MSLKLKCPRGTKLNGERWQIGEKRESEGKVTGDHLHKSLIIKKMGIGAGEGNRILNMVAAIVGTWRTSTAYDGRRFGHFRHCPPLSDRVSVTNVTKTPCSIVGTIPPRMRQACKTINAESAIIALPSSVSNCRGFRTVQERDRSEPEINSRPPVRRCQPWTHEIVASKRVGSTRRKPGLQHD